MGYESAKDRANTLSWNLKKSGEHISQFTAMTQDHLFQIKIPHIRYGNQTFVQRNQFVSVFGLLAGATVANAFAKHDKKENEGSAKVPSPLAWAWRELDRMQFRDKQGISPLSTTIYMNYGQVRDGSDIYGGVAYGYTAPSRESSLLEKCLDEMKCHSEMMAFTRAFSRWLYGYCMSTMVNGAAYLSVQEIPHVSTAMQVLGTLAVASGKDVDDEDSRQWKRHLEDYVDISPNPALSSGMKAVLTL